MISLPANVTLTCSACRRGFSISSLDFTGLDTICCPFCRHESPLAELLPIEIRLLLYREIREQLENAALDLLNK